MEFITVADLLEWMHQQHKAEIEFPTLGNVSFHLYRNKVDLRDGGMKGCLWLGRNFKEADMGFLEKKHGVLTVAVVPCGKVNIDYTDAKAFPGTATLDDVRKAFPNGRNTDRICGELSAHNGE